MNIKRHIALFLSVICCITVLSGCGHKDSGYDIKDDGKYLAGGTIPESSKVYPVIDENMTMSVTNNSDNSIGYDDIWIINHYVDLFCSFDDTEGDGVKTDEISKFLTSYTVDEIMQNNEDAGSHHKLVGVQVLQIDVKDADNVEAAYWERTSSDSDDADLQDTVAVLFFKRSADGQWYENGIAHCLTDTAGSFKCVRDDISGQLSIVAAD